MNEEMKKAINVCRLLIDEKLATTDKEIDGAIDGVLKLFPLVDRVQLKRELLSLYSVRVGELRELVGKDARKPWLNEAKANQGITWDFWMRYKAYLSEQKHFAPKVISQIDAITDNVLDKLFDPRRMEIRIDKKGLVVGQVQSGKTANYIGLACKAADAGFNLIIILAGTLNNLRSQTQARLDEGFLGFDTQYERAFSMNSTNKIGVGLIPGYPNAIAHSITTSLDKGDFTKKAANALGVNFASSQPFLMVVKKNGTILKRIHSWLQSQSTGGAIANKSLLIIDDEADNASINTARPEDEPTTINRQIRQIIALFTRSAYVGYTATPFANIFIPIDEDNLFPRDFIIKLPCPSNYMGPEKIFGVATRMSDEDLYLLPMVTPIRDYADFVPDKHHKNDPLPSELPTSLKMAIKAFIMTCAIRMVRGQGNEHNSMLVHVSRFQRWQNHIKGLIEEQFAYYKGEIEADDPGVLKEFKDILETDTAGYKSFRTITSEIKASRSIDDELTLHSWEEIKPVLYKVVQKMEVKSINGSSGDYLTYYEHKDKGISIIAVGGDKLSRGLTLEGLSVSYFLRASKMYDTLMQMGRWFGYRPHYNDLCRLYTSPELNEWYRHITMASLELMEEFDYLSESGGTPDRYALKVRNHPGCLQITSVTKMRYTNKIRVSWAERLVETYQLKTDRESIQGNFRATSAFLSHLGEPISKKDGRYRLWKGVSPDVVCEYLLQIDLPESLRKVNMDLIVEYIRQLVQENELTSWSVALASRTGDEGAHYRIAGFDVVGFLRRNADETSRINQDFQTYYIRNNHLLNNSKAELIDLDEKLLEKAKKGNKMGEAFFPALVRRVYRPTTQPLLLIYPLNPTGANIEGTTTFRETDTPFIGLAIAFPHSDTDHAVEYTANQTADFAETENYFEENR